MSDDLISREAAIALVYKIGYINVSNQYDFKANCRVDKIRQELIELPTAFDKEKVLDELGELTGEECTLHECGIRSEWCKPCIAKKAIEIVEKGGIG